MQLLKLSPRGMTGYLQDNDRLMNVSRQGNLYFFGPEPNITLNAFESYQSLFPRDGYIDQNCHSPTGGFGDFFFKKSAILRLNIDRCNIIPYFLL